MGVLEGLKPERVFYYFEELTKIPRCSYDEKEVSNYLKSVGEKLGLETIQDEALNIIIKKPATKGYEDSVGVVIQGHMDMVCEKEEESDHDFTCEPIELLIEGDLIKANKTTLGADNGIAVAMGLAILEDDSLEHPAIELVVTIAEEVEMDGAFALSEDILEGRRFLNIDSEEEGILTMGSAGGELVTVELDIDYSDTDDYDEYSIEVTGLMGGHSGMEIDKPKGNSNKILNSVFKELSKIVDIRILEIDGGTKDNAIPRQTQSKVGIKKSDLSKLEENIDGIKEKVIKDNQGLEGKLEILVERLGEAKKVSSKENTEDIISLLKNIHTGVYTMIPDNKDIVESSCNLAIIDFVDEKMTIQISTRSSSQDVLVDLRNDILKEVEKTNARAEVGNEYPEWEYKSESELRDVAVKVYKDIYKEDMHTTVIHAGLECGIINNKYPDMDIISFGPNIRNAHTPEENRMNFPHCAARYDPDALELASVHLEREEVADYVFMRGKGCGDCRGTGYRGRRSIAEILTLNDEIRELIVDKQPIRRIKAAAYANGTRSLRLAALDLVKRGATTIDEIRRVTLHA